MKLIKPQLKQDRDGWTIPDKGMEMVLVNKNTNTYEMKAKNSSLTEKEIKHLQTELKVKSVKPAMIKRWQDIKEAILSGVSQRKYAAKCAGQKGYSIASIKNAWAALSRCNGWKLK